VAQQPGIRGGGLITSPGGTALLLQVHDYFGGGIFAPIFVAAFCAAAILPLRRVDWRSSGGTVTLPAIAAPLMLPAALLIIESFVFRPMYVDRYVLYGEMGAALLAGSGLTRIGHWLRARYSRARLEWAGGLAGVLIVAFANIWAQNAARQPESRLFDFGSPSAYLATQAQPGDGVLFATGFYRKAKLAYPEDFRNLTDFSIAIPPGRLGTFQGRNLGFWAIRAKMLKFHRIWVVGLPPSYPPPIPPFPSLARAVERHFVWQSRRTSRASPCRCGSARPTTRPVRRPQAPAQAPGQARPQSRPGPPPPGSWSRPRAPRRCRR
jgi:mannosyltransferase